MPKEKDHYFKKLEDYNDVFADIFNGLVFGGERVIEEDDLETGTLASYYNVEKVHEAQERDAKKYWKKRKREAVRARIREPDGRRNGLYLPGDRLRRC